ncbi:unnamed protein product [Cylicostephanus goldi]|uniref:Bestrophin homolog n=1 Tax=Cylicostephanus goldi TaxID=71465 RepID=A0A3P6RC09_CYLGO|nr:unnamed protein product [Cylicostephanus goldi]
MTINYNLAVSTSKPWTLFKLLLKWRGSIWKAVMLELVVWLMFYGILSIIYRTALSYEQQKTFERVVIYCEARLTYIPLNFMLGFFVTAVTAEIKIYCKYSHVTPIVFESFLTGLGDHGHSLLATVYAPHRLFTVRGQYGIRNSALMGTLPLPYEIDPSLRCYPRALAE